MARHRDHGQEEASARAGGTTDRFHGKLGVCVHVCA